MEAEALKDPYLGSEHLLLAVLQHEGDAAAKVFAGRGFTYETALTHLRAIRAGEVVDIRGELKREYLRICPGDEPDTWMAMVSLNPNLLLPEMRAVPDGAGQLAAIDAFKAAWRRQLEARAPA